MSPVLVCLAFGLAVFGLTTSQFALGQPYQIWVGSKDVCVLHDGGVQCEGSRFQTGLDQPQLVNPYRLSVGPSDYVCALDDNGVRCWGYGLHPGTPPTGLVNPREISHGYGGVCVLDDFGLHCTEQDTVPDDLRNPDVLTVGRDHACVLDQNTVRCWGSNEWGQIDVPDDLVNPRRVTAGGWHTCALDDNGVRCWGKNGEEEHGHDGRIEVPPDLVNPSAISAGTWYSCAIDDTGVRCWGKQNGVEELSPPQDFSKPLQITVGSYYACVLDDPVGVRCWGDPSYYPLPSRVTNLSFQFDSDEDGIVNSDDPDDDNDGIPDIEDAFAFDPSESHDADLDGLGDNVDQDDDNDGLTDDAEALLNTSSTNPDTDQDGLSDFLEDNDGDGLTNGFEINESSTNPISADTDGDGLPDGLELAGGTDASNGDTDRDGIGDGVDPYPLEFALPLVANGCAELISGELRLTPHSFFDCSDSIGDQTGSAFTRHPYVVSPSEFSFEISFKFRVWGLDSSFGAEGLALVLQNDNDGANTVGIGGDQLGYGGIQRSVAIEFDTALSPQHGDPSDNHIGLNINGNASSTKAVSPVYDINDGQPHYVWVDFHADPTRLDIFTASADVKPAEPVMSENVDLANLLGEQVFVGFSASSGIYKNVHAIEDIRIVLADTDGDGLLDTEETLTTFTNPLLADTDGDGLSDGVEWAGPTSPLDPDSDDDGVLDGADAFPTNPSEWRDTDGDNIGNNEDLDDDGDRLSDEREIAVTHTSPTDPDTDGDGMPDGWEFENNLSPLNPVDAFADADGDGISNRGEFERGSNPHDTDTDGDGFPDRTDVCVRVSDDQFDSDSDGVGDACDPKFPRLVNLSTRGAVRPADGAMIGGIIIEGNVPKTVLIRARGPSLTTAGVAGALADPTLSMFDSSGLELQINNNWLTHPRASEIPTALAPQGGVSRSDLSELIKLVSSGFALIEVPSLEKGPTSIGWNLAQNAITSVDDTAKLRGKNVGLAHAYCSPAPTCAIDVDDYRWARAWLANEGFDLKAELKRPESVVFASGKLYSIKILFRMPARVGPQISRQVMSPANDVALEFRCATRKGTTVQDLIPPSVHPSGNRYKWLGNGSILSLPTIPDDLLAIWQRLNQADQANVNCLSRDVIAASPRDLALIADALQFISADCGYVVWRNVVWALLSTGWQNAKEIACVWSETAPNRFDLGKFYLLVNSYDPTSKPKHTLGTVYHYARKGGWNG